MRITQDKTPASKKRVSALAKVKPAKKQAGRKPKDYKPVMLKNVFHNGKMYVVGSTIEDEALIKEFEEKGFI